MSSTAVVFENQSHRTKPGKKLHSFKVLVIFYTPIITKMAADKRILMDL